MVRQASQGASSLAVCRHSLHFTDKASQLLSRPGLTFDKALALRNPGLKLAMQREGGLNVKPTREILSVDEW